MSSKFGLVGGQPLVTYAMAAVMCAVFGLLQIAGGESHSPAAEALSKARTFYEQNPQVKLSPRNRRLLGEDFVDVIASSHASETEKDAGPVFSPRMQRRTQERFESIAKLAFGERMSEFPAWRYGIVARAGEPQKYLSHAFVHESLLALAVSLIFLLVAGIGLETAWGSALFAGFCLLGTVLPAVAFSQLGGVGGIPFSGGSGLVAALLGAYLIRGLGGGFALSGWVVLPVWAFVEYFFVRGIWLENVDAAPLASHGVALALGAGLAAAGRLLDVEKKLVDWASPEVESAHDPALEQAERAFEQGRPHEAFELLRSAHLASPDDREVALALWGAASEAGRGEEAVGAILPILRDELRSGAAEQAIGHWRELSIATSTLELEATLLVRMGETLLGEGHADEARDPLGRAVEHPRGLSPALAQRVVRVARDFDFGLTQRAASIALQDDHLSPDLRDELQALAAAVLAPASSPQPASDAEQSSRVEEVEAQSPKRRQATTQEATNYPLESDIDIHNTAELTDPEEFERLTMGEAPDGRLVNPDPEDIDPAALSIESLEWELGGGGDVADALGLPGSDGSQQPEIDDTCLEEVALPADAFSPESDSVSEACSPSAATSPTTDTHERDAASLAADLDIGGGLRPLKLVEGVPTALGEEGVALEIDGHGASKLPFDRIDAVAVVAVSGLSAKPVLVIDFVLNWASSSSEPLKVIRLRGNRFDPLRIVADAAGALEALERFVAAVLAGSGAIPLPDADAVAGQPFASHADLESYQRRVLMAE